MRFTASSLLLIGLLTAPGVSLAAANQSPQRLLFAVTPPAPFPHAEQSFAEVRKLIRDRYYTNALSDEALYWAAVKGMLRLVSPPGDPERAKLWAPRDYANVEQTLRGVRLSVGVRSRYDPVEGSLTVTEVTPGSPAAGVLRLHDRIMRINGERLAKRSAPDIERMMRGRAGEKLKITVVRDIQVEELEIEFAPFRALDVERMLLPAKVGYVSVRHFALGVVKALRTAVTALHDGGADALVIDLRGNTGGVFAQGLQAAELFIAKGQPILHVQSRGGKIQRFISANTDPLQLPLAVLMDRKTASAAEIMARALQVDSGATLVGTRSFGKAAVEQTFPLDNGYRVKFIVGALFGPRGRSWYPGGLQPDVPVAATKAGLPSHVATLGAREHLARDPTIHAAWKLLTARRDRGASPAAAASVQ